MNLKVIIALGSLLMAFTGIANQIIIDTKQLRSTTPIYMLEGGVMNKIPDSGTLEITVQHLPTLVKLVSLKKSKIITHQMIWLTGNTLAISGSLDTEVNVSPSETTRVLAPTIEKEWQQADFIKETDFIPSGPYLVYLTNKLKFQEVDFIQQVVDRIPEREKGFWAAQNLLSFIHEFESVGYSPSKKQFEHLSGINASGEKERFDRPQDKYLLIDFSSSGCRPCLKDIDQLVELKKDFQDRLEIVSIWNDAQQAPWMNIARQQKDKITWVSLRDESQSVFKKFDIQIYPTYALVDPSGQITKTFTGSGIKRIRKFLDKATL